MFWRSMTEAQNTESQPKQNPVFTCYLLKLRLKILSVDLLINNPLSGCCWESVFKWLRWFLSFFMSVMSNQASLSALQVQLSLGEITAVQHPLSTIEEALWLQQYICTYTDLCGTCLDIADLKSLIKISHRVKDLQDSIGSFVTF